MNKKFSTLLILTLFVTITTYAQKPFSGQVMSEKVPLYAGSTGSGSSDSTRLPILFQARILGLTPGASYKYYARFISIADTASSTTTGYGTPIIIKKNGSWRTISSPDLNTGGAHDTFSTGIGQGEYTGWFGAVYTNNTRFSAGNYVYPVIIIEEIGVGAPVPIKLYITDSIQMLQFSTSQSAGNGTAIYGSSFSKAKSIVLLYDNQSGTTTRPISIAYAENEGFSFSNMQSWYNNSVNAKTGNWGTIIPNDLSGGITRIESRDPGAVDTIYYANIETDGIWGSASTVNATGGATSPIFINSNHAPLLKPLFEFVTNLTTLTEKDSVVNMLLRRRYGNADSSKISAYVIAGTATNGTDYNILTKFPMVFRPYGDVIDTIKVRVNDDFASEVTENVAIRLINPVNGRIGVQTTHSIDILDNDIPVITFAKKTQTVREDHGILKVKLRIASGSTTPTSVRVFVKSKSDSTFIPAEFKLGSSNRDTTVQFPGGNPIDSMEFNISIVNDLFSEDRSDTIILVLRNPTSPATIGADSLFTLIIEDNDAPPIYNFTRKNITVKENVGSVKIRINRTPGNDSQSDIIISANTDSKYAQPGIDYTFNSQLITFFDTDPDSVIITIPIINDNLSEPKEDAVLYIRSSFNATIGKTDTVYITIMDDDLPEYTISKVLTSKAPNFVLDSLNAHVALRGIVHGINMGPVGSTQGLSFTLIDRTGGIQVYKANGGTKGYTVTEGDSIQVYGRITQLNGMAQLSQIDTIIKLGSNRTLRTPRVVTVLNESTESDLVKYNLVKLVNPSQWPSSALAANTLATVTVQTVSGTFDMIIDSETDIDGKAAPTGFFNVVGIGAQNDPSSPYTSNYSLFPRRFTDITNLVVPVYSFTTDTSLAYENRDSSEGFTLQCANLTSSQQIKLVIKGGNATIASDYQSNSSRLFILTANAPSTIVKTKMNDDAIPEPMEYIIWVIRENAWGTLIGADSIHVVKIIDDETNSILEKAIAAKVNVYPNPSKNSVTVSSEDALMQEIVLYDVNGREVKRFVSLDGSSNVLNIEGLVTGIYTVSILTDKGIIVKTLSIL